MSKTLTKKEIRTKKFNKAQKRRLAEERRRCPKLRPSKDRQKEIWNYNPQTDKVE